MKVLGVLGGMGPLASAEFLKILAEKFPAKSDQEHPKVIYLSDPTIPDRSDAILHGAEDPRFQLKEDLMKLVEWGSEVLAVPCNTAHYFIESFREELPVPLVGIIDATLNFAMKKSPKGAWFLSTQATERSGIYEEKARLKGYHLFVPSEEIMKRIQNVIYLVKGGGFSTASSVLSRVLYELRKERNIPFIAACTELPIAYRNSGYPLSNMISSLEALAFACVDELLQR